jgi:hypothetical protein
VGLGTSEVLERYRESTGTAVPAAEAATTAAATPNSAPASASVPPQSSANDLINQVRFPSGRKVVTAASLLGVVGLAVLLINVGRESDRPAVVSTASVTADSGTATPATLAVKEEERKPAAASETVTKVAEATPAQAAGTPAHEVVVEGKARTWLKVVIDDNAPAEFFLAEGKSASYKALNKIKVVLGNSTGSRVLYNGKEVDGKQFMGTIRSYKFPENARFPQDTPSKRTPTATGSPTEGTPTASKE